MPMVRWSQRAVINSYTRLLRPLWAPYWRPGSSRKCPCCMGSIPTRSFCSWYTIRTRVTSVRRDTSPSRRRMAFPEMPVGRGSRPSAPSSCGSRLTPTVRPFLSRQRAALVPAEDVSGLTKRCAGSQPRGATPINPACRGQAKTGAARSIHNGELVWERADFQVQRGA
jgi:hypothetical protein